MRDPLFLPKSAQNLEVRERGMIIAIPKPMKPNGDPKSYIAEYLQAVAPAGGPMFLGLCLIIFYIISYYILLSFFNFLDPKLKSTKIERG